MKVTHQFTMHCKCPVDDRLDYYEAQVETDQLVKVEDILKAAAQYSTQAMYQEDLTRGLSEAIQCQVTTIGMHSGVRTTVSFPRR